MATIPITTANDRTSNYSPSPGDDFVLSDLASLIVDNSTVSVDIEFNSRFQEITLENTSTTQPNIINIDTGGLNGQNGAIILDGLLISIDTADGTASQAIQFPADANSDYPSFVGYCYIDGVIYTQISSFTGIRSDFRGRHFTYDNVTGVMTFGNGTNGDMPTGNVQVENIYVELGGSSVNISDGFIRGNGHCVFVDGNFWSNPNITVQSSWGIINNSSKFQPYQFFKHKYSAMNYISVGSGENARMLLAEDTVGDTITFQTESTSSPEVVENFNVPMWGVHELRFVTQRSSNFSRTRLYNNGGSATLKIMQGYGTVFTPYGGTDGNWVIEWSDGYKTTDLSPYRVHHGRYEDAKQNILYRLIGSTSWSGERSGMTLFDIDAGEYVIGSGSEQMVIPSDVAVDEIVNTSGGGKLTWNNLLFEGQASSGTRNFNLNSPAGTLIANVSTPNITGGGNQAEPNASFRFVSFIGQDPAFNSGMNHSIITKDAAKTLGQIWFMPHAIAPNGEVLSGSFDDLLYGSDRLYITQVGTKVATQSDVISGCGIVTNLTIKGWLTGEFAFEYKLWEVGTTEPATYQTLTEANVQASQAGYTTATKWNFKYTVEKISGAANSGYIQGIYFDCPVDPLFKWEPEGAQILVAHPGIWDGSGALLLNETQGGSFIGFQSVSGGVGASFSLREGVDYEIGDTLDFRAGYQSGFAAAEKLRILFVAGESDIQLVEPQVLNPYYPDLQIDGATQDSANGGELSVVGGQVKIAIDDADGRYDERGIAAWTYYLMNSQIGLQYYFFVGDLVSIAEFSLKSNVPLDNIGTTQILFSNPTRESAQQYFQIVPVDNTFNFVLYPSTSGLGITKQPVKPIYIATPDSVFTEDDRVTLESRSSSLEVQAIPTNPLLDDDARLDSYSTFDPSVDAVEGSETYDEALRLIRAEAAGKVTVTGSDVAFRDAQDTKDRIVANTDEDGQRLTVTVDGS